MNFDLFGGLYTDMYELTMAQGYFLTDRHHEKAVFDYFYRRNPFDGGFTIFSGSAELFRLLAEFTFNKEQLNYLSQQGFHPDFIEYLSTFTFKGDIYCVNEGEVCFPNEPLLIAVGNLIEVQIIETLVLNILNFNTLISTKARRIKKVTGNRTFIDFGMRRAQGSGSLWASRAARIGGADATSNVAAGKLFDIPLSGTQAHSWIQSFDDEEESFYQYSLHANGNIILLVDTYNTLKSGIPNVIKTSKRLEAHGKKIYGIRIDSGDLAYFSRHSRKLLDDAGLSYIKIFASNQLNEYIIESLMIQGAPIDGFGVGTEMITGKPTAALDGVYKLSLFENIPRLKISENNEKITLPGYKKLVRYSDNKGMFYADGIHLKDEKDVTEIIHPVYPEKRSNITAYSSENILNKCIENGEIVQSNKTLAEIANYADERLEKLPPEHARFVSPHIYKVGISDGLYSLREEMIKNIKLKYT